MKKYFFFFLFLLPFYNCIAQEDISGIRLDYYVCDSLLKTAWDAEDYVTGICLTNYFLSYDSTKAYLYYNRALAKAALNDLSGYCEDMETAMRLDSKIQKDFFFRQFCDKEKAIKEFRKYYYPDQKFLKEPGLRPEYTLKDTLRGQLNQSRSCFDVSYYDLNFRIFPKTKSIQGCSAIYFDVTRDTKTIQIDLTDRLEVDSIKFNDSHLNYTRKYDAIFVQFDEILPENSKQSISIYYSGKPQIAKDPPWLGGFVWSHDYDSNHFIGVCCEHLGASSWWPNKDHLSDKPDSMKITIDVPEKYMAISNGNMIGDYDLKDGYHRFIWQVHYPIINYDVTFYCGKYITVEDSVEINGEKLNIDYYVLPEHKSDATRLFGQSKEVLRVYSELFGPYPFPEDGFALVESPYEGMENQGAIAFGKDFKKRQKVYDNNDFDYIIVHETAHEWWGNAVSFSDMADAWLSEGFATYSELLFMEKEYGYLQFRKELRRIISNIYNIWPLVGNYDVNECTFVSGDIYNKGAVLLHNLRCIINNDEVFMRLMRNYFRKYKYQSINTKAFIEMANSYSGLNLEPFFDKFLYDTDPPVLTYNLLIDNDDIVLIYRWNKVKPGFAMPFQIIDNSGKLYLLNGTTEISSVRLKNARSIKFIDFLNDDLKNNNILYTYYGTEFNPEMRLYEISALKN